MSHYTGWSLSESDRTYLLRIIPPSYPDVIAEHVTCRFGVDDDMPLPTETGGIVVGHVDDGAGVQALVVEIGGTTQRPDGRTYHITWSLDRSAGRKPADSNEAILELGWETFPLQFPVGLHPAMFRTSQGLVV